MRGRSIVAVLAAVGGLAMAPPVASAAFPDQPRRVLFMRDPGTGFEAVYRMDPDGSHVRRLTPGRNGVDADARWSPDGRRIVFASMRDGDFELFTARSDGTRPRRLTRNGVRDVQPSWSPTAAGSRSSAIATGRPICSRCPRTAPGCAA